MHKKILLQATLHQDLRMIENKPPLLKHRAEISIGPITESPAQPTCPTVPGDRPVTSRNVRAELLGGGFQTVQHRLAAPPAL